MSIKSPLTKKFQFNLPALKLTLYFLNEADIGVDIECYQYCLGYNVTVATLQTNLHTPLLLHKKLFRIGMANVVYAKVYSKFTVKQFLSGSDCNKWIRSGPLMLLVCSPDIFSVEEISRAHNLSVRSIGTIEEFDEMIPNKNLAQFILGTYWSANYSEDSEAYKSGLVASEFNSISFIYCVLKQGDDESKDFLFWLRPFKTELWLVLVILMTLYSVYSQVGLRDHKLFAVEVCKSVFKFVEVMIGNGVIRSSRFQLCFAFLGFFICLFYSNCLLGYVLKKPPPVPYTGIKQILNDGYKIVDFNNKKYNVRRDLAPLLTLRGIQVSTTFHVPSGFNPSYQLAEKKIEVGDSSDAQTRLAFFENILNHEARFKYDCRVLPEVVGNAPRFWAMYTLNRNWIGITINRIIEAGLQTMWSTLENRALMLDIRPKGKVGMTTDDIIGARRIQSVMGIVGGIGMTLALLCLITEKLYQLVTQ